MTEFPDPVPSLAQVRREGAECAGRRFLEALHAKHGNNVSAIARDAKASRQQVKVYLRRYGIGSRGAGR